MTPIETIIISILILIVVLVCFVILTFARISRMDDDAREREERMWRDRSNGKRKERQRR